MPNMHAFHILKPNLLLHFEKVRPQKGSTKGWRSLSTSIFQGHSGVLQSIPWDQHRPKGLSNLLMMGTWCWSATRTTYLLGNPVPLNRKDGRELTKSNHRAIQFLHTQNDTGIKAKPILSQNGKYHKYLNSYFPKRHPALIVQSGVHLKWNWKPSSWYHWPSATPEIYGRESSWKLFESKALQA